MQRTVPAATLETDRNQLVIDHVGLVKAMAHRLAQRLPSQVEMNELISVGVIGLIDAAGRYKPALGVPFDAFARRRVQGAMLDALRELDWAPRSLRRMRRDLDRRRSPGCAHELKREPTEDEVAGELSMSRAEYDKALDQIRTLDLGAIRQLDATGEDGSPLLELCIDPRRRARRAARTQGAARRCWRSAIRELPERERQILALYYEEELTHGRNRRGHRRLRVARVAAALAGAVPPARQHARRARRPGAAR